MFSKSTGGTDVSTADPDAKTFKNYQRIRIAPPPPSIREYLTSILTHFRPIKINPRSRTVPVLLFRTGFWCDFFFSSRDRKPGLNGQRFRDVEECGQSAPGRFQRTIGIRRDRRDSVSKEILLKNVYEFSFSFC